MEEGCSNMKFPTIEQLCKKQIKNQYLPGPLFRSFSFINVSCGKEEMDDVHDSWKNIVEVALVTKIVHNLYKAWKVSREECSIGVISPYTAQIVEIKERIGKKFQCYDGFVVNVMLVDELQGKEEDVIILTTVRSCDGSLAFLSNNLRTKVALPKARHCLWILGNENPLSNSESIWKSIIKYSKDRNCFFNVEGDEELAPFVIEVKRELDQLDQLNEMLDADSLLLKNDRWKVLCSESFRKSFEKIKSSQIKKLVISLLLRLASGWRPKKRNINITCEKSKQILKQFKVKDLYLVCSVDVVMEDWYMQVLRVWDLLPLVDITKLAKHLDTLFCSYTDDFLSFCKVKCLEGDLEVPMHWETSCDIIRQRETGFQEDVKVSESLLLMKFYSLSSGMVSHLLSGCDGRELELPFELTSQEMEIICFDKSSFILGRSGTGKTTVLVRKLFQKEQLYYIASEGFHEPDCCTSKNIRSEDMKEAKESFLRQIFVTLNPRLCYAVKQNVSGLKRFVYGGNFSDEWTSIPIDSIDDMSQFEDIPDSFVDLPQKFYPLVITFHKFLTMLDGTIGRSFYVRFPETRDRSDGHTRSRKSMALKTFIRMKEVNFDKFNSSYWPHFNMQLTKGLESSTVFTEIMSHIKGGLQVQDFHDGKFYGEHYISQSSNRASSLSVQEKHQIYDIFLQYENLKMMNGEYDLADLVTDLHRRLRENKYEGNMMDFVYIDEVQDLTMRQIALCKYICRNVNDGFVFSGDTAQTIAKGIDFRFEDIRCLFYKEFVMRSRCDRIYEKQEKGLVSDKFHLSQNFRTHASILKLAQSVTNLLYYFFPLSIDFLSPETSPHNGEIPVFVETVKGKTAFLSMFHNAGDSGTNLVGFGAEQVILVRDDNIKSEISNNVGKHALVLTISECKGLEFQDVLLYNFLSSSPVQNQWRIIYEYMKEQDVLVHESKASPSFSEAKHRLLCSELKQLYVAITRTKQRLWIFEDEINEPMYEYWKKLQLVKVQGFDDSFVKEIQVTSSKEEWKSRGIKLFHAHNYESAKMCFGKAGEEFWEKWAEAAHLRAAALHISGSSSKMAHIYLAKAAETFIHISKYEQAAQCFYELKDYKIAGEIYEEKCGDSKLEEAGDCFSQAGCHKRAAVAYAKGKFFSTCLNSCFHGKLFNTGLGFIASWKQHVALKLYRGEIEATAQKFLESVALIYKNHKDYEKMMKFVKAFHSKDLMRNFLRNEGFLDELLQLETDWGCFLNAAIIAKQTGKILLEAELLEKAKYFEEASLLILFYVFANSLWASGNNGWPLKPFRGKKELLDKAKTLARNVSGEFFEFVCTEEMILSKEDIKLSTLKQLWSYSKRYQSVRGEILCTRKILDVHFSVRQSEYMWENNLVSDPVKNLENVLSQNLVSVDTLVYFWNVWKQNIWKIFESLENKVVENHDFYGTFCLDYLGVRKQLANKDPVYCLLIPDAYWVKQKYYEYRNGKLVILEANSLARDARRYWSLEMLGVGMKALEILVSLYQLSKQNSLPLHCQSISLLGLYEVAKSLWESKYAQKFHYTKLYECDELCMSNILENVFSLDWRSSSTWNMTNLRERQDCKNLLEDVICQRICLKSQLTLAEIGTVVMIMVGMSGKPSDETYWRIFWRFDSNSIWRSFLESFGNIGSDHVHKFHKALAHTYYADSWGQSDYISPVCFMYLVERLLLLVFYFKGYFFSTKYSFLEWLTNQEWIMEAVIDVQVDEKPLEFVAGFVTKLLYNEKDLMIWIKNSKLNPGCHSQLVLRLFVVLCLLCVNSGKYYDLLSDLLCRREITWRLPLEFYNVIRKLKPGNLDDSVGVIDSVRVIAQAFQKIGSPLVAVSSGKCGIESAIPDVIFIDLEVHRGRDKLSSIMFK